jgi:hypothetical protein
MDWDSSSDSDFEPPSTWQENQNPVITTTVANGVVNVPPIDTSAAAAGTEAEPAAAAAAAVPRERRWERAWQLNEMRAQTSDPKGWSLAADKGLQLYLQQFAAAALDRTKQCEQQLDECVAFGENSIFSYFSYFYFYFYLFIFI